MGDEIVQGVIDTIDVANEQRLRLAVLLDCLKEAKIQVEQSASSSREKLQKSFEDLKLAISQSLDERLNELLAEVQGIEDGAMKPLQECEVMIKNSVTEANNVLSEGKQLLTSDHETNAPSLVNFKNRSFDLSSLPEVPPLSEVPCLFVDLPEQIQQELTSCVQDYGKVIARAPVQITDVQERPGSLLIKWSDVEEDSSYDICEYRLQSCSGEAKNNNDLAEQFKDVYQGPHNSFTKCHLRTMTMYSFRVSGRAEGVDVWSPWSIPWSAMTSIPHYEWDTSTTSYSISNENKIACTEDSQPEAPVLYSNAAVYTCGHSITFKIVDCGKENIYDGLGLTVSRDSTETMLRPGALFVNSLGSVFIDGQEKLTKLPNLTRGSVVTFETELLEPRKIRVTIEVNAKIVTFDWVLESSLKEASSPMGMMMSQPKDKNFHLYFSMLFSSEGWTVGVE